MVVIGPFMEVAREPLAFTLQLEAPHAQEASLKLSRSYYEPN